MYEGFDYAPDTDGDDKAPELLHEIDGKKVLGVYDGIIFGSNLGCVDGRELVFNHDEIDKAIEWLQEHYWDIKNEFLLELNRVVTD